MATGAVSEAPVPVNLSHQKPPVCAGERPNPAEFMELTDDGQNQELWEQADLILVGLSGMSKTPISKHLADAGVLVSNYPLVMDCAIPDALEKLDQSKVVALKIKPDVLLGIRQDRAYKWGIRCSDPFIDYDEIEEEVRWVTRLYRRHPGWRIVSVTDRKPGDVATSILTKILKRG